MGAEYSGRRKRDDLSIYSVHKKIAIMRAILVRYGEMYGLAAPQTLALSRKLDKLIVQAQKCMEAQKKQEREERRRCV